MLLGLRRSMDEPDVGSERDHGILVRSGDCLCKLLHTAVHVRNDVDHASADIEEDPECGVDIAVLLKDVDLLRLVVVVQDKVIATEIGNEIAAISLHRDENV